MSRDKQNKKEVEKKWARLTKDMQGIRARGELCLLAGDLNKHVGVGDLGVPGNLLDTRNWTLINGMGEQVVRGGPFTRPDPATNKMSCLDLFIVSCELLPYVKELFVDSNRKFAVSRAVKMGNSYKQVFSDHFSCFLTLTDLPRVRERRAETQVVWNLGKEGGWDKYKELTDKYSEALQEVVDNEECMDTKMEAFEKLHDRIKYKSFGKVKIGRKYKDKKEERTRDNEERSNEAKDLFEEEEERARMEIEEIKQMKISKVGKVWELRKIIVEGKKALIEATAIINPEDGKVVVSNNNIKKITLQYCKDTLTNNVPARGYQQFIEDKQIAVNRKLL